MAEQSKSVEWVKIDQVHPNPENPREINEESFNKLKKSIQEFPEMLTLRPLVVKEGVVLGGNMRLEALKQLGYSKAPIIDANELTDEQIKEFIIKDNVPFGKWDWDVLANDWDAEQLNDWGLDVWQDGDYNPEAGGLTEEERKYVSKIEPPVYEPTMDEPPSLNELVDEEKTKELVKKIEAAKIPDEVKDFLRLAAQRHLKFNYENIAEYYSHATPKVKELFENSALVVIDAKKAIENGYLQLNERLMEAFEKDSSEREEKQNSTEDE